MSVRSTSFKQPLRQGSAPQLPHCSPLPVRLHALRRGNWSTFSQHSLVRQCSSRSRCASKAVNSLASTLSAPHRAMSESPHSRVLASTDQLDSSSTAAAPIVTTLHSSEQYQDVVEHNPGKLIVLMCKAQSCRPCKMFSRKFQRMAEQFQDAVFVDIMGDETNDTRRLMMKLEVRATPTFFLYRDGRVGATLTGINENNLRNAIIDFGLPSDKDSAPLE